jgi:hypothetical protein
MNLKLNEKDEVSIFLYKNVKNIQEIKKINYNASFMDASLISSCFQILVSSFKSLNSNKTNNYHSEVIYNVGISKNVRRFIFKKKIKTNLDLFGIENSPESVLIVMLNPKKEEVEEIKELMKDSTALEWNEENLEKVQNVEKIQKIYKVSTNFKEEIISKLAIRDL